ncbi:endonuclease/exonuclease/phosphatase family protein [Butyrivibrio sp. INlla16]|uniref:endonuclease/exonuclease/phosphatase family protein n=1 Tax=Butyrivibrio sp. INlla16 TaxID=1520807 RepID=UPI000884435B|nr:endonuclease/exonuclease/phosphatase family protein [Butyrivibrio sp. INlla16]SDB68529.1 Metal-dependent hydrolase, endonuclease/exonuclease/phosphatase family [Butyrivibrio sp. INlla16]
MKALKKAVIALLIIILMPVLAFSLITIYLWIDEYKPADIEVVEAVHNERKIELTDNSFTMLSWNIGYAGLGDNADFFMDGGKGVMTADKERVDQNIEGIKEVIDEVSPDFTILQEVDRDSDRTYRKDVGAELISSAGSVSYAYAPNYRVAYVPIPIPPIGKVESGLMSMSAYDIESSERVALPCPFKWPVRLANLKRCLLVTRIPVEDTGKELVIINLHLEAYDRGEGKIAQTKLLKDYLEKECEKGNYVIAGGDFNQVFSNVDTSKYPVMEGNWQPGIIDAGAFSDNFNIYMDVNTASSRALSQPYEGADKSTFQLYVIDGFLVSKNIEATGVETLDYDFKVSDHNPVVLKFKLSK